MCVQFMIVCIIKDHLHNTIINYSQIIRVNSVLPQFLDSQLQELNLEKFNLIAVSLSDIRRLK